VSTWIGWWLHDWGLPVGSVVAAGASAYAAITSYRLSRAMAVEQKRAQDRQVQVDLFEYRFECYYTLMQFLDAVLDGSSTVALSDVSRAMAKADFLFTEPVRAHVQKIAARMLAILRLEDAKRRGISGGPTDANTVTELRDLRATSKNVFEVDLKVSDFGGHMAAAGAVGETGSAPTQEITGR
jgi:hypothetical protein